MGLKSSTGFGQFFSTSVGLVVLVDCSWVGFINCSWVGFICGFFWRVLGSSGVCFCFSIATVVKHEVSLVSVVLVWVGVDPT